MSTIFQLLLLLISRPLPAQKHPLPDEIAVCEAIVLAHLEKIPAKSRTGINYYFDDHAEAGYVSFPEEFFEKYRDYTPSFKRASEFNRRESLSTWTPEWSWSFKSPQRVDQDTYTVWGGYYCGGLCALHCDYRVVRKDSKWVAQANGVCIAS
jgi:hypothetical protein